MMLGKNTPTSALSGPLNFCSRLRKIDADSCRAAGMLLALFLSSERHRYWRMAAERAWEGGGVVGVVGVSVSVRGI
jgi:hypothetical protein